MGRHPGKRREEVMGLAERALAAQLVPLFRPCPLSPSDTAAGSTRKRLIRATLRDRAGIPIWTFLLR